MRTWDAVLCGDKGSAVQWGALALAVPVPRSGGAWQPGSLLQLQRWDPWTLCLVQWKKTAIKPHWVCRIENLLLKERTRPPVFGVRIEVRWQRGQKFAADPYIIPGPLLSWMQDSLRAFPVQQAAWSESTRREIPKGLKENWNVQKCKEFEGRVQEICSWEWVTEQHRWGGSEVFRSVW